MFLIIACPAVTAGPVCHPPTSKATLFPPTFVQPLCECGSVPQGDAGNQVCDSRPQGLLPCSHLPLPAQDRGVSSCPWESPCHRHIPRARSRRHPGPASAGSPGDLGNPEDQGLCACGNWWPWLLQKTLTWINPSPAVGRE